MLIHKVFTFRLHVNGKSKLFVNFFPDRVRALQKAKRMTVAEVLRHLDISPPMFSMIRNGKRNPSVKTLRRLERAEREAGMAAEKPPAPERSPPAVREPPANYMPDHRDLSEKLDEILRRMDHWESRVSKRRK